MLTNIGIEKRSFFFIFVFFFVLFTSACTKLVEVNPPLNNLTSDNVYASDATAIAFMNGVYTSVGSGTILTLSLYAGLSADELRILDTQSGTDVIAYYKNLLTSIPSLNVNYWNDLYPVIYQCNAAIQGLKTSIGISPKIKQQLMGEALFMRAMFYFYLVNLYGDVPLAVTTDYRSNAALPRSPSKAVWQQIINDLEDAKSLLSDQYLEANLVPTPASARIRPTRWAAAALLARVYLYINNYANAEVNASLVINNTAQFSLQALDNVFTKNNPEAIFQLQPTANTLYNTVEGYYFVLSTTGPVSYQGPRCAYISTSLLDSFENGDLRKTTWVKSVVVNGTEYYYPYKYKLGDGTAAGNEYSMLLRLGEQYLIRAEARIRQGGSKFASGIEDINAIRNRARAAASPMLPNPLPALSLLQSPTEALAAIAHERQVELFTELGHRWLDIKRTEEVDEVMQKVSVIKGSTWQSYQQWYPIPNSEILNNPSLAGQQNVGYQ